jgi:hypothetical protein
MSKPFESQYSYKKQIGLTLRQKKSLDTLRSYGVNINDFIRIAVREKIARDWPKIKEEKSKTRCPF